MRLLVLLKLSGPLRVTAMAVSLEVSHSGSGYVYAV